MNSGLGPHAPPALALLMVNRAGQVSRAQTPLCPGHLAMRNRPAPFRPEDSEPGQRPGVGMETLGWAGTGEHLADRALRVHTCLLRASAGAHTRPPLLPVHTHMHPLKHAYGHNPSLPFSSESTHTVCYSTPLLQVPTSAHACTHTHIPTTHLTPGLCVHTLASIPYSWLCTHSSVPPSLAPVCVHTHLHTFHCFPSAYEMHTPPPSARDPQVHAHPHTPGLCPCVRTGAHVPLPIPRVHTHARAHPCLSRVCAHVLTSLTQLPCTRTAESWTRPSSPSPAGARTHACTRAHMRARARAAHLLRARAARREESWG